MNVRFRIMIVAVISLFFGVTTGLSQTEVHQVPDIFLNAPRDRTVFKQQLVPSLQELADSMPDASVYRIAVTLSPSLRHLSGRQTVRFTNQEQVALSEIYFRLFLNINGGSMWVNQVTLNGVPAHVALEQRKTALNVLLPEPLLPGASVDIAMAFEVEYPTSLSGNYGQFAYFQDVLISANFYPMIPQYSENGWYVDVPPKYADYVVADASFYLVQITGPKNLVIAASGGIVDRTETDETATSTYAIGPARDFYFAGSNRFEVISQTVGDVLISSYAFPEYKQIATIAVKTAGQAITHFNERFGQYPYRTFHIVAAPTLAMGIEYPGMTVVAQRFYDPGARFSGLPGVAFLHTTVVHEVVHQWLFNQVGNDQVNEPWLDEALTQYYTWRYYLDNGLAGGARGVYDSFAGRLARIINQKQPIGRPVSGYSQPDYSPIIYGRGPLFIKMLADMTGRETFDRVMVDYIQQYKWQMATGQDFYHLVEKTCQCDMSDLFREWVFEG